MKRYSRVVVLLFVSIYAISLSAQLNPGTETGLPSNSSFHGSNLDQVNLQNGSLHIAIPIATVPQRGGQVLTWEYIYDSIQWTMTWVPNPPNSNPPGIYVVNNNFDTGPSSGWRLTNPTNWSAGGSISAQKCSVNNQTYEVITGYSIADPQGSLHPIPLTRIGVIGTPGTDPCIANQLSGTTLDGSGITYNISTNIITLKNGTQITAGTLQDTNGNQSTGNGQDTLRRTAVTTANGPSMAYVTPLGNQINGLQYTTYTVTDPNGNAQTFEVTYQAIDLTSNICHLHGGCTDGSHPVVFPLQLSLPNGTSYKFTYNNNTPGELARLDLPTGGFITYTYTPKYIVQIPPPGQTQFNYAGFDAVATHTLNAGTTASQWTYGVGSGSTTVTDPLGNTETHTFSQIPASNAPVNLSTSYYETKVVYADANGNTLRTVTKDYTAEFVGYGALSNGVVGNVRPIRETVTLDNGQVMKTETDYETFGSGFSIGTRMNPTEIRVFAYGSGAPGSLMKRTDYTYLHTNNSAYTNLNIVDRPLSVTTYDGANNQLAQTTSEYDIYTHQNQPMVASGAVQHNTSFTTSFLTRGNRTAISHWRKSDNTFLTSTNQYDDAGNLLSTIDPLGNKTSFDYTDSWGNGACAPSSQGKAYITKVTDALGHFATKSYDSCTGALASSTDQNGNLTSFLYDEMGRTLSITDPPQVVNGTSLHGVTTYGYTDTPNSVSVEKKVSIDGSRSTDEFFALDGLGREISHSKANGESVPWDKTDTCYDQLGRKGFTSYPYQTSAPVGALVCSGLGDIFAYDGLSRIVTVTHSDQTVLTTSYSGRATDVVDEGNGNANHSERVSQVDALGHLVSVCEVTTTAQSGPGGTPAACGQDKPKTGFLTSYTYDALGNVLSVNQGSLGARTFAYDSLSHLLCSANPETGNSATCPFPDNGTYTAGTTRYSYDNDGHMITRVRPAANQSNSATTVTTTYSYDALGRLTEKLYSDGITLPAQFGYDQSNITMNTVHFPISNSIGRLSWTCSGTNCGTMSAFGYDSMGRTVLDRQATPQQLNGLEFDYTYDLVGDTLTSSNGNGISYTLTYSAAPRLTTLATNWISPTKTGSLISNLHYDAFGDPLSSLLHNNITEGWSYDTRGRLESYSAMVSTATRYGFSGVSYAGNGSILSATDSVNGTWSYTYDDFNRLATSNCTATCPNGSSAQAFTYQYDRYGNRWNQTATVGGGPQPQLTFRGPSNVPNNRIDGETYDAAGNLMNDSNHNYTYDAENRIISVDGGSTATYAYDAGGRRVSKAASGGSFEYLFDLSGRVVTELIAGTTTTNRTEAYAGGHHVATQSVSSANTYYPHADWLGTERARTNSGNTVIEACQSLPFGDGQVCTHSDVSPLHFTGKQRDTETNLDDFDARYYSSQWGRFVTPDWDAKPVSVPYAKFGDPQTLNLYNYVENAPLNRIDADGHTEQPVAPSLTGAGNGSVSLTECLDSTICNLTPDLMETGDEKADDEHATEVSGTTAQAQQQAQAQNSSQNNEPVLIAQNQAPQNPAQQQQQQPAPQQQAPQQQPLQYDMHQHVPPVPAAGPILPVLQCMQTCSQFTISSTAENTPVHPQGTPHRNNQAADLEVRPGQERATLRCAAQCGAHFGLNERAHPTAHATGPHVHVQVTPGRNGGRGDLPPVP